MVKCKYCGVSFESFRSTCPSCGAQAEGRFCASCGAPLEGATCRTCAAALTPGARFCHHCGMPVTGPAAGEPPGRIGSGSLPWIVASIALKPTSSILIPGRSVNLAGAPVEVVTKGRHDPCVGIRATPIAEAMVALVLMDQALRHRAQCGDVGPVAPRIA